MYRTFRVTLRQVDLSGMTRPQLVDAIEEAARTRSALDAFEARAAVAIEALADDGAAPSATIRASSRSSQREADKRATRASRLATLPEVGDALADGRITAEHADALGEAAATISPEAVVASGLLGAAERRPADLFAREVRDWVRAEERARDRDADEGAEEARRKRRRAARRLSIFENADGMTVLHGEFDPVAGAELRRVLGAETERLYQLDGGRDGGAASVRTPEQRRADALMALLGGAPTGSAASGPPRRHQLVITATVDGTTGEIGDATLPSGAPLSAAELERLACGSDLMALLLAGDGRPLWMGRSVRLATDAQWTTLVVRDRGCRGCGLDPSRCEAHHIVAWAPPGSGPTDIDNLVLLCGHCHHLVHDHGWELEWADGGWTLSPPGGFRAAA